MPKIHPNRIVYARNEPLGLLERIVISNLHRFDEVGKPRKPYKPEVRKVIPRPFDPELAQQADEDIERLALAAYLTRKRNLLERLTEPPKPLLERIGPSRAEYTLPPPLSNIHFRCTKILERTKDYNKMFEATADRLEPIYERLEREAWSLPPKVVAQLRAIGDGFDELYHGLEEKAARITNKQWRLIKRDLKKVGAISFASLGSRFPDICRELAALELTFKYED